MNNTSFRFRHTFLLTARSSQSRATSCSIPMSDYRVNSKCNRVKGQRSRWLIYALLNFLLRNMLHVFRNNHRCSWKFPKFCWKTPALGSLSFLNMKKLYKDICSVWISRIFAETFLIDWWYKCLKNTVDLLLFYEEHFYGFSESDLWKRWKKTLFISQQTYLYTRVTDLLKFYEVLFCTYFKGLLCL